MTVATVAACGALAACLVAACSSSSPTPSPEMTSPAGLGTASPVVSSVQPQASPVPPLVGQWSLDRTCAAIVDALRAAGHPELIPQDITELVEGVPENGPLPTTWDPKHPCAEAKPPTEHSHTFWADGTFNSYDEAGRQVDDGTWALVDGGHFRIGEWTFKYAISGDELRFEPVVPSPCTAACQDAIGWLYGVSFPGEPWTRVTTGLHVPPESVSTG